MVKMPRYDIKLLGIVLICTLLLLIQFQIYRSSILPKIKNFSWHHENNMEYYTHNLELPELYIITPTYRRPEQLAELTQLSHTLRLVPNVKWLVIDDAEKLNDFVENLLQKSGLNYTYMCAAMPEVFKKKFYKPKGAANRNKGIEWIRQNAKTGVVYFADDDNTYELELFSEIRKTKKLSMFPVGLVTQKGLSSPIVLNCTMVGFYDGWIANRKYPIDMAGFAVSVEFLLSRPKARFPYEIGYQEDGFLKSLSPFNISEIELLASCCTKILVWHTQTKKNKPSLDISSEYNNTNLRILKKILV